MYYYRIIRPIHVLFSSFLFLVYKQKCIVQRHRSILTLITQMYTFSAFFSYDPILRVVWRCPRVFGLVPGLVGSLGQGPLRESWNRKQYWVDFGFSGQILYYIYILFFIYSNIIIKLFIYLFMYILLLYFGFSRLIFRVVVAKLGSNLK